MAVRRHVLAAAAAAVLGLGAFAQAVTVPVPFDPDGPGPAPTVALGTIDLAPGNALAQGAVPLAPTGLSPFTQLYQAKVSSLRDINNNVIPVAGLGTTFEITAVAGISSLGAQLGPVIIFNQAPAAQLNFLEFWVSGVNSSDLAGTGFNDGTKILSAVIDTLTGSFLVTGGPTLLDQSPNGNQWGPQQTVVGTGSLAMTAGVTSADPAYFKTAPATVAVVFANSNENLPFQQTDPSHLFVTGPNGAPPTYAPVLGPVNGISGPDIILQADANASFSVVGVPLPSSVAAGLVGLGSLIVGGVYRRSRR